MTKYHPSMAVRVRDQCYLGATNAQIADLLGVSVSTLALWRVEYPEFDYAWNLGKGHADAQVAASLYKRANGYTTTKKKETKDGTFTEEVHVPPDVGACIFWLCNRRPDLWQQRVEHNATVNGNIQLDTLSDIEKARRVAFLMAKAAQELMESNQPRSIEHGDTTDQS